MTPIENMFPNIEPFVRGASEAAMRLEIRNSAIEFCQRTRVWQPMLGPFDIMAGLREVDLLLPTDSELVEPSQVWLKNQELDPVSVDGLRSRNIGPTTTGTPECWEFSEFVIKLWPIPTTTQAGAIYVRTVLQPAEDAEEIPDELFGRYRQQVANGALMRLLKYATPWAQEAVAAAKVASTDYAGMFQADIASAAHKVSKSNTKARRRVTPAFF